MKRKEVSTVEKTEVASPVRKGQDSGYVTSDDWKCKKSPSGAHFWKETHKDYEVAIFECRYCSKERQFSTSGRWQPPLLPLGFR